MNEHFAAIFISILLLNSGVIAQESIREAYNESGDEAKRNGDFGKAEKLYRLAIKEGESRKTPDMTFVDSLLRLSRLLLQTEKLTEASQLADRVLKILEMHPPKMEDDSEFLSNLQETLSLRAYVYTSNDEFSKAEDLYKHWLSFIEHKWKDIPPMFTSILKDFSRLYVENADSVGAAVLYHQWVSRLRARKNSDGIELREITQQLADQYKENGQYTQAESIYRELLELDEKNDARQSIFDKTEILSSLGDVYQLAGRNIEAEAIFRKILAEEEKETFKGYTNEFGIGSALEDLADYYVSQSRYAEAEAILLRCRSLKYSKYEADEIRVIELDLKLAKVKAVQGNLDEAEKVYKTFLTLLEKRIQDERGNLGRTFALQDTLFALADFYEQHERTVEADSLLRQWVERTDNGTYANPMLQTLLLDRLVDSFISRREPAEAVEVWRKRLSEDGVESGEAKLRNMLIRYKLVDVYARVEDFANARLHLQILIDNFDPNSVEGRNAQTQLKYRLTPLMILQGQESLARKTEEDSLAILRQQPAFGSFKSSRGKEKAGDQLFEDKKFHNAESAYWGAIIDSFPDRRSDEKRLSQLYEKLGHAVGKQGRNREAEIYFTKARRHDQ